MEIQLPHKVRNKGLESIASGPCVALVKPIFIVGISPLCWRMMTFRLVCIIAISLDYSHNDLQNISTVHIKCNVTESPPGTTRIMNFKYIYPTHYMQCHRTPSLSPPLQVDGLSINNVVYVGRKPSEDDKIYQHYARTVTATLSASAALPADQHRESRGGEPLVEVTTSQGSTPRQWPSPVHIMRMLCALG